MGVIKKGVSFSAGEQLTADKINDLVDLATFDANQTADNSSIGLTADGKLQVKNGGISPAKLSTGAPSWQSDGLFLAGNGSSAATFSGDIRMSGNASNKRVIFTPVTQGNTSASLLGGTENEVDIHADFANQGQGAAVIKNRVSTKEMLSIHKGYIYIGDNAGVSVGNAAIGGINLYYDQATGTLRFRLPDGTVKQITTTDV